MPVVVSLTAAGITILSKQTVAGKISLPAMFACSAATYAAAIAAVLGAVK